MLILCRLFSRSLCLYLQCGIHNHYRYRHFLRHFHSCSSVFSSPSLSLSACCLQCPLKPGKQQTTNFSTILDHTQNRAFFSNLNSFFPSSSVFCCSARLLFDFHSSKVISKMNIYIRTRKHTLWLNLYSVRYQCDAMRYDAELWTLCKRAKRTYYIHNKNETHSCGKRLSHKLDTMHTQNAYAIWSM